MLASHRGTIGKKCCWYSMKVLTFGWEFPPYATGGLGMACQGLTRELVRAGVDVLFVLPYRQPTTDDCVFAFANDREIKRAQYPVAVGPYSESATVASYQAWTVDGQQLHFSRRFIEEVYDYAAKAADIASRQDADIIHAHDWTTYLAGIAAQSVTGQPLVLHVHATAFDQSGGDTVDPAIFAIEKAAFRAADKIITVSHFTKQMIVDKHEADAQKIEVVHNGIDVVEPPRYEPTLQELRAQGKQIVLYHGRITIQKGVDYFVRAAAKVLVHNPQVVFIISGKGDLERQIMEQVAEAGLSQHILFAGALWYEERDRMYQSVDLVVMPSVSEPFGLVPLEAIQHGVPALISKQSGVAEVISHVLKVDFWDVDEMANQILAALRYPVLHQQLRQEGRREVLQVSWNVAAQKVVSVYQQLRNWLKEKIT